MNKTSKIILGLVILIIIIGGIWYGASRKPTGDIKIAYISALSGEAGIWGQSLKRGFDFAVEEINSNGGIDGRRIQVIYEDDECDASKGVTAFNKAIDIDKVKIITGTVCSSVAMSVAPKTQANRILYIATAATNPDVPKQGDLIFRLWNSDAYEAKEMGKYAVNSLGFKKLSILYFNDNPAGIALKDSFKESVESNGGAIVSTEAASSTEKDFRTILIKIIKDNPDGIYVAAIPGETPLAVNQARELGYKGVIFLYGPSILSAGIPEKIEIKDDIYYPLPLTIKETSFWDDYKQKTGLDADLLVGGGYDSMKLIEYGLKLCGENNNCIRDKILTLKDYQTTRGKISFDKDGDVEGVQYEIKKLQ